MILMEEIENQVVEITYKQWQQINADIKGLSITLTIMSFIFIFGFFAFMIAIITDGRQLFNRVEKLENKLEDTPLLLCEDCLRRNYKK